MKFGLKYFILIIFLAGCNGNTDKEIEESLPLYKEPVVIPLNTADGYKVNQLTGDSIKPLISSSGDTIKTGVRFPFYSKVAGKEIVQEKIIEGVQAIKTIIADNVQPLPNKPSIIPVDTAHLKKVKLGEGDQSLILRNRFGILPTGVPIPVTGKKMPFSEPPPVKAAPMRFKDNATSSIQYLDVDQGLSYSYVYDLCEDKKGNLWFGLESTGICKYDGVNITNYSVKEGLSNNTVVAVLADRNNNLWFGTQDGVNKFDGNNFTQFTEKEGFSSKELLSISEDKKGNLWFSTKSGVTKFDGKYFTHYTKKEGLPSDTVYQCLEDKNGFIWIATHRGAAKFDGMNFTIYSREDGLSGIAVTSILEDEIGNIWFGIADGGINKFDGKIFTHFTNKEGLSSNLILSMINDKKGNIWVGTSGGGLNKFDGKNFTQYGLEQGLSNSKIRKIIEDKSGNIWFGTDGGGVNKLNAASFDYKIPGNVIENYRVRPILKDKNGNLWFGTDDGHVGKLEAEQQPGGGKWFTYFKVQDKLFAKGQRSLLQDKKENIWIGTTGSGIIKFDGKIFINYFWNTSLSGQTIHDILEDKKGNIWFGQRDGSIAMYDGNSFSLFTTKEKLPGSIIYSMLEDKKGNIWFCTEGAGVYKYDGTHLMNYTEKEGLFSKSILSVTEDENGNIWFGTSGSGVCMFDGKNFTYYTKKQGLPDNNVWSSFSDAAHQLWFGTDKGLTLFLQKKVTTSKNVSFVNPGYVLYNFGSQDGLKAIDFNLHSVCVDDNNRIWWGTGKSVPSFDLNKGFHPDSIRSLTLNYIEINERFYDYRNLSDSLNKKIKISNAIPFSNYPGNLKLSYDLNHLTFHFAAIDWSAPDKIKYSYRMVGLDKKWSKPSGETMADYRNVSHGKYQFQVKAVGQSQVWTEPFTYSFIIRPAWWQTWWFKAAVMAMAALLLLYISRLIYKSRLRKQKALMEKQLAVQMERQRISTEMHDDIGAGLSGVRLLTEMTKNKLKETSATSEMDKIHQSVGEISAKMKEVIWSLNTENDSLGNLIAYIQRQVKAQLENYPAELIIELPGYIPDFEFRGNTRRNIYLSVKEAVHNIIKHSGADRVTLSISCNENLVISVADNGRGTGAAADDHTGNGMKNMRQRIEQSGGQFFIKKEKGLTLIFSIPLKPHL